MSKRKPLFAVFFILKEMILALSRNNWGIRKFYFSKYQTQDLQFHMLSICVLGKHINLLILIPNTIFYHPPCDTI